MTKKERKKKKEQKKTSKTNQTEPNQTKSNKHTNKNTTKTNKQTNKQTKQTNKKQTNKTKKHKTKQKWRGLGGGGSGNKATCLNHVFIYFLAAETSDPQGNRKCSGFEGQDVMKISLFLFFFLFLLICIPEATFYRRQADDAWARCAETCWVLAAVKTSTIRPNTRPPLYPLPRQPSQGSVVIFVRWMPRFKGLTTK